MTSKTSRSISVSWDAIACIDQNGPNFRYEVEFQQNGTATAGTISNLMFTANGLVPFTDYTFRVRGANSEGDGIFTQLRTIQTDQDSMLVLNFTLSEKMN